MKRPELRLPTVLGLLVAVGGLLSGLYLMRGPLNSALFASADESPKEVKVTNNSEAGFNVSWITNKATTGFVQYGEITGNLDLVVSDDRDQEKGAVGSYFTHYTTLKGLSPDRQYQFRIGSGKSLYDSGGQPYQARTTPTASNPPLADVAYGQVVGASGDPAEGAIVYLQMQGAVQASAIVKTSGSWVIPLATIRNSAMSDYFSYDKENEKLVIFFQGASSGVASVLTTSGNDKPVPTVTLGNDYDYSSKIPTSASASADLESKFSSSALAPATEVVGQELVVLTPKFEEKVNSTKPLISGKAPAGTTLTIEVHSETAISDQVTVGKDGTFNYTVPTNLAPGDHTITVSAMIGGVLRQITRSFTVYAAGENSLPSFSATPSATLTPSPKPTPTLIPTQTPKPTATPAVTVVPTNAPATPSVAPTIAPTIAPTAKPTLIPTTAPIVTAASNSATPVSGDMTPTWIILMAGTAMLVIGGLIYKYGRAAV